MGYLNVNTVQNTSGRSLAGVTGTIVDSYYISSFAQYNILCTTGDGTRIPDLVLTVTPKRTTNVIMCEWNLSGEIDNNTLFTVFKKVGSGSWGLITTAGEQGYNNSIGNVNYSGISPGWYDGDFSSTPANNVMNYSFVAGTTSKIDIGLALRNPNGGTNNFVNRTNSSWGQASYETTMSYAYLFEIYA